MMGDLEPDLYSTNKENGYMSLNKPIETEILALCGDKP